MCCSRRTRDPAAVARERWTLRSRSSPPFLAAEKERPVPVAKALLERGTRLTAAQTREAERRAFRRRERSTANDNMRREYRCEMPANERIPSVVCSTHAEASFLDSS